MPDHPHVLRRMLTLRQFSLFGAADLGELATVADNVAESILPRGAVLARAGLRVPALHLIVDGRVECHGAGAAREWSARDVFGELEVLADRRATHTAIVRSETRTLTLAAADVRDLLEDNFGLLLTVLRDLAARMAAAPRAARPPAPPLPRVAEPGPLGLVERLVLLRHQAPYARGHLQALLRLAHASDEIVRPAGAVLARAGDPAPDALTIIDGQALARGPGGPPTTLGPGDAIGGLELLGGLRHRRTVEAMTVVRALRSGETAVLDTLEDHPDFALAVITSFARALLDAPGAAEPRGN